jgi:hypothetical protein
MWLMTAVLSGLAQESGKRAARELERELTERLSVGLAPKLQ